MHVRIPATGIFLGIGAVAGLGIFLFGSPEQVPDVGELEPIRVAAAEAIEVKHLQAGQTFGAILQSASLGSSDQYEILLAFQEHSSPRRMRPGTEISLRRRAADGWLRGVDVAISPDQTLRLDRGDLGWSSDVIETPITTDTLYTSGEITTDLWSAMVRNPDLADMNTADRYQLIDYLDKVFQWQIDFSRSIQTGDTYRMVFERQVRPDGSMRTGRILAAEIVNVNRPLHAIWFEPEDGPASYFDLEGESVRRAFLTRPLEFRRISSRFSNSRMHPVLGVARAHVGVDYAANTGTPVQATGDGVITRRGANGGAGNMVEIRHANGYVTKYLHLNGFRSGQRAGSRVAQGEVIGYVGMTGLATGPHLHYEMHHNGRAIDPLNIRLPAGDPIAPADRDRWDAERVQRAALLMALPGPSGARYAATESQDEEGDATGGTAAQREGGSR